MKKIFLVLLVVTSLLLLKDKDYVIPNESIRFRIIPNSNSSEDIIMKNKSTYEVMNVIEKIEFNNLKSSREEIMSNIETIENRLDNLFKSNNYNKPISINYGLNEFPQKTHKGVKYEEGYYESLVIEIGEAKGNNYWCVLYPPLCLIDESKEKNEYKSIIKEVIEKLF